MTRCYFLSLCLGSAVDQQSNNATLFNLVEQVNVPPDAEPGRQLMPLEAHAYFQVGPEADGQAHDVRFVLVAESGIETYSNPLRLTLRGPRFRIRIQGMPLPTAFGDYTVQVDRRHADIETWHRESVVWPLTLREARPPDAEPLH